MKTFFAIFAFSVILSSCMTNYSFIRSGTASRLPSRSGGCDIMVLTSIDQDLVYDEIGICIGTGEEFIWDDGTEGAMEQINECACERGGNAVFIEAIEREVYGENNSYRTRITATLMVISESEMTKLKKRSRGK